MSQVRLCGFCQRAFTGENCIRARNRRETTCPLAQVGRVAFPVPAEDQAAGPSALADVRCDPVLSGSAMSPSSGSEDDRRGSEEPGRGAEVPMASSSLQDRCATPPQGAPDPFLDLPLFEELARWLSGPTLEMTVALGHFAQALAPVVTESGFVELVALDGFELQEDLVMGMYDLFKGPNPVEEGPRGSEEEPIFID